MNVFQYAAICEKNFENNLSEMGNYQRKTTFYSDLSIADYYGVNEVKDTYNRVMKSWIDDITYITEFVMSLNHKSWEMNARHNGIMTKLYSELYYKAYNTVVEHYKDDEENLHYFFSALD